MLVFVIWVVGLVSDDLLTPYCVQVVMMSQDYEQWMTSFTSDGWVYDRPLVFFWIFGPECDWRSYMEAASRKHFQTADLPSEKP